MKSVNTHSKKTNSTFKNNLPGSSYNKKKLDDWQLVSKIRKLYAGTIDNKNDEVYWINSVNLWWRTTHQVRQPTTLNYCCGMRSEEALIFFSHLKNYKQFASLHLIYNSLANLSLGKTSKFDVTRKVLTRHPLTKEAIMIAAFLCVS